MIDSAAFKRPNTKADGSGLDGLISELNSAHAAALSRLPKPDGAELTAAPETTNNAEHLRWRDHATRRLGQLSQWAIATTDKLRRPTDYGYRAADGSVIDRSTARADTTVLTVIRDEPRADNVVSLDALLSGGREYDDQIDFRQAA